MISAEFEALPTKGFEKHTCGSCMHLLPHRKGLVGKIKRGSGKGQFANWVCKCNSSPEFNEGRVCEDGTTCEYWKDRYADDASTGEWLRLCSGKRATKTKVSRTKAR